MRLGDLWTMAWEALRAHRLRTRFTYAAIAIGIASVLVLTSLGEGARTWILERFASLGSNILITLPGRTETRGGPPLAPSSTRDLTLDDMQAIGRRVPGVVRTVPIVVGEATVKYGGASRSATLIGSTSGFLRLRQVRVARGSDLPDMDPRQGMQVCVLGRTVHKELFGTESPLGAHVRIGDSSFLVVGVLAPEGQSMMVDLDDVVLVPVASAMRMLNQTGLFRILVQVSASANLEAAKERVNAVLKERHDDEEDFTILTPGAVAASLGDIIRIVTAALAGIAAVSLGVGGIGVMNVMVVSVSERTREIGLMKAVGASSAQVLAIFLAEAMLLSLIGGLFGVLGGVGATRLALALYPTIPFHSPAWAVGLSIGVSLTVGLVFGILPARRAARLEPIEALGRAL